MSYCWRPDKQQHPSREAAQAVAVAFMRTKKARGKLSVYQCGDHWHIGKPIGQAQRKGRFVR